MRSAASRAVVLMVLSGFAALGYQVVWLQQAALWLGHESAAVLAVVTGFFGGLAAGAFLLGARIERSPRPWLWYGACEAAIALWAVVLAELMKPASAMLLALVGSDPAPMRHWSIAFAGTFALLLPATAAMGATMPAMERILAAARDVRGRVALVYAANTFGAVAGVAVATFWLVPRVGLASTALACAAMNLLCAAGALSLRTPAAFREEAPSRRGRQALGMLAATGCLGIGYEVLVVRVLSQWAENTVFTFAILLVVYLVGTTLGAMLHRRLQGAHRDLRDRLVLAAALACGAGVLALSAGPASRTALAALHGRGMAQALAMEALLALAAFLAPTIAMGALFSELATEARIRGVGLSRALAVNTLGAAAAPLVFGLWALPGIGAKAALLVIAVGYLALSSRLGARRAITWMAAGGLLAIALLTPPLAVVDVPAGGRLVSFTQGAMANVAVVEDAQGVKTLHIDNREREGSSATRYADARQATIPLALDPGARRALFLGLGSGVTAYSAAQRPGVDVDAVELLPEVIDASHEFTADFPRAPRLVNADARRFVRAGHERYDVIVADNFHPARSGSGSLYTVEHFEAVKARLAADGLFCQWLPLHQLDIDTLRSIVRTFTAVFPGGWALLATHSLDTPVVGLVGRAHGGHFDAAAFGEAGERLELLGAFIAGPDALAAFAHGAELNTDDHPVVAYRAPRFTYGPQSPPRDRLVELLHLVTISPGELLAPGHDTAFDARLASYWAARDRFIEAGRDVRPTGDVRRMLAQVREPLLQVLATSPDFRPAYDPLLRMAIALAPQDPASARSLLRDLGTLQPARPEARQALSRLELAP